MVALGNDFLEDLARDARQELERTRATRSAYRVAAAEATEPSQLQKLQWQIDACDRHIPIQEETVRSLELEAERGRS